MDKPLLCSQPPRPSRPNDEALGSLSMHRLRLIQMTRSRWIKGSTIRWCMQGGSEADRQAVRDAVATWQRIASGLTLTEVSSWSQAEVRIQFRNGGSWSYVGTDCLHIPKAEPTMQFGWPLDTVWGHETALHEWGHALGFPHEHQNPYAGIVWDEQAVLRYFSGSPNYWTEEQIRHNILDKLDYNQVDGTEWDPNSIMHYPFEAGLILRPEEYRTKPLEPRLGLSFRDVEQTMKFYAADPTPDPDEPVEPDDPTLVRHLPRGETVWLKVNPLTDRLWKPQELRFEFTAKAGECIKVETGGPADTVLVLQDRNGVALRADDDSGVDRNASVSRWSRSTQQYRVLLRVVWLPMGVDRISIKRS